MERRGPVVGACVGALLFVWGCAAGVEAPPDDGAAQIDAPAEAPGPLSQPHASTSEPEPVCPVTIDSTITEYPPGAIATLSWDGVDPTTTEILVYPPRANAACAPIAILHVPAVPGAISSLAFDGERRLYTLEYSGRISIYASGSSGAVAPERVVNPNGLYTNDDPTYVEDIAIDSRGRIYASVDTRYDEPGPDGILVYESTSSGDAAPIRFISGASTGFQLPTELALDAEDRLYVADYEASAVYVFPDGADGDVAPLRALRSFSGLQAMTVAPDGTLFLAPEGTPDWSVRVYGPLADGVQPLEAVIQGPSTQLGPPIGMAVDIDGGIAVITPSGGSDYARHATGDAHPRGTFDGWNAIAIAPRRSDGA